MRPLIAQHRTEISTPCRRYGVRRLDVFGSAAVGTDINPARSDADFRGETSPEADMPPLTRFFRLADDLPALLGRAVDLAEAGSAENPFVLADIKRARDTGYAR